MFDFHEIQTNEDAQHLLEQFNGFHDAYITDISYHGNVRSNCSTTSASTFGTELSVTYMVTSMVEVPVVEVVFRDVFERNFRNKDSFMEVFGLQFDLRADSIVCTSGCSFDRDVMEQEHYVIAGSARWRLVDQPGLRLTQKKRGGCSDGWLYIPIPADCPAEDLVSVFRQLEKSTEGGQLAIVRPAGVDDNRLFSPEKQIRTAETLPSFLQEEVIADPDGNAFVWYRITDDADLRLALEYALNGVMLSVMENGQFIFTMEIIVHAGAGCVVFQNWQGSLKSIYFCNHKYMAENYFGGGMGELAEPKETYSRPISEPKYQSVNELDLFEFHDAEVHPWKSKNGIFRGVVEHLNIHGHTIHNPEDYDKELESALLHIDGFRIAEEDEALIDTMRHPFTVLKWNVEKADGQFIAKLEAVTEKHKRFSCTFYFNTIEISWNYYRGKAWYVREEKPTQ